MSSPLRQRNFALLWGGGLISLIGDRALMTALPFYVYQQTHSTIATAAMFAALYLPRLLFGSLAGVLVDRWDRRRLMIVTNLVQAVLALLLLLVRSPEWLWLSYVLFFVSTTVAAFFEPAEEALLPQLVPTEQLFAANALNALNNQLARLMGPPIGGLLLTSFGLGSIAVVNSLSFLVAALCILGVKLPPHLKVEQTQGTAVEGSVVGQFWEEWVAGMRLMRDERLLANLLLIAGVTSIGGAMFDPLVAPWVEAVLQQNAATLGLLSTVGAVGGILAGAALSRWGVPLPVWQVVGWSSVVSGLGLLWLYNLTTMPLILCFWFLVRFPLVSFSTSFQTLLQTAVPDAYRGRVAGTFSTVNSLLGLGALGLAGGLGQYVGIVPMLSVGAILTLLSGVLSLWLLRPAAQVVGATVQPQAG
jgi:predicted MFS family arabinose efflux permease